MRKNKAKIKRAKEIASKKKATKGTLEKRAQKQAIEIVKKKIAQGKDIKKMSFAARQQLDDKVKKKQGLVKKLAKRLLKKVKTDEKDRLTKKSENK
jgi:cell division protein FtsX